jgi:hypothetical protein
MRMVEEAGTGTNGNAFATKCSTTNAAHNIETAGIFFLLFLMSVMSVWMFGLSKGAEELF